MIVIDIKGELYQETAAWRRSIGHDVRVLDPWGLVTPDGDSLNPLDLLKSDDPALVDDAYALAGLLVDPAPIKEAYWDEAAQSVVAGLMIHAAATASETSRTLGRVWSLANAEDVIYGLAVLMDTGVHPSARPLIGGLLQVTADQTRSCIISVMHQHLRVFGSALVHRAVGSTKLDLAAVREGRPVTLYIVVPPTKLRSHAPLLRLWLAALMGVILGRTTLPALPTLFLMDELAQLGPMEEVTQAVTLARGYGLRCLLMLQSPAQLKRCYPRDHETLVENCATLATFGHCAFSQSRQMAELLGDITPEALFALPPDTLAVRLSGRLTEIVGRADYLRHPDLAGRRRDDPMRAGRAVAASLTEGR